MTQELQPIIEVKPVAVSAPVDLPPGNGFEATGTPSLTTELRLPLAVDFGPVVPPPNHVMRLALHHAPGLIRAFGLLRVREVKKFEAINAALREVNGAAPDLTFMLGTVSPRGWDGFGVGTPRGLPMRVCNVEVVGRVNLDLHRLLLMSNELALKQLFPIMVWVHQTLLVTGPRPESDAPSGVDTRRHYDWKKKEFYADVVPCVYLNECRVRTVPVATRRTPFGAAGVLHFQDGGTDWQMANALQQWHRHGLHLQPGSPLFWQSTLDLTPSLCPIYLRQLARMQKGKRMANRKESPKVEESATLRTVLDAQLGFIADVATLPRVADRIQVARDEGHEQGRRESHIEGLLAVLESRSIRLTKKQRNQLEGLRYEQLPTFETAMLAEDAADFGEMARLNEAAKSAVTKGARSD